MMDSLNGRYGEPWYLATGCSWRRILSEYTDAPCIVPTNSRVDNHPDLMGGDDKIKRAVRCVNACEGVPPTIQPGTVKMMADAAKKIDKKFRSGNSIPVERITLTVEEWGDMKKALDLYDGGKE